MPFARSWTVFGLHFKSGNFLHMYESSCFFFHVFRCLYYSPSYPRLLSATATKAGRVSKRWKTTRRICESVESRALRIRYFFGLLFSRWNPRIRCIDNGIRLLPCHPLPRNNTLPSYNSLAANQYFCPRATHGVGCLYCSLLAFSTYTVCCSIIANWRRVEIVRITCFHKNFLHQNCLEIISITLILDNLCKFFYVSLCCRPEWQATSIGAFKHLELTLLRLVKR